LQVFAGGDRLLLVSLAWDSGWAGWLQPPAFEIIQSEEKKKKRMKRNEEESLWDLWHSI
jgi:hypothetical protein